MYLNLRFPGFKKKAFTLNFDDGTIFDIDMVNKMKPYGVKGTFNLNSGRMGKGRWLNLEQVKELYEPNGMEIGAHGVQHLSLTEIPGSCAAEEVLEDRKYFEKELGHLVQGFAYAMGTYNDEVAQLLKTLGIHYARTVVATKNFDIPKDWLRMPTTCKYNHPEFQTIADRFLNENVEDDLKAPFRACNKPQWFTVWGHSYEFNDNNTWDVFDGLLEKLGGREDIFYCTTGEMYDYVHAYHELQFSADGKSVYNPAQIDIYLNIPTVGQVLAKAGELTTY